MIAAIATKMLSDPYNYKFPYDCTIAAELKKKCPRGPGTNNEYNVLHFGIFFYHNDHYNLWRVVSIMFTTIIEIELRSISVIVVAMIATIAEEWIPYKYR